MRCPKCRHRFALESSGMGSSDPPGPFFYIAVVAVIVAIVGFVEATFVWNVIAVFAVIVALFSSGAVFTGIVDQCAYGGPKCPVCDASCHVWPWSL